MNPGNHLQRGLRFVEIRRAHGHRRCACHHEFDGVCCILDAAHADDGNLHRVRRFPDQFDGNRFDAGSGQAAGNVRQFRFARLNINRHGRITVRYRQRVAARIFRHLGVRQDPHHVWTHLGNEWQLRRPAARGHHLREQFHVRPELRAAFLDVRAGNVQFQSTDTAQRVKSPGDLGVFVNRGAPDVDDGRHLQFFEERPVFFDEPIHTRSLQTDGVEHAAGDFRRARRGIATNRMQPDAFHDNCAKLVQVEELRVFDAVTERARGDHDRVLQRQRPDFYG